MDVLDENLFDSDNLHSTREKMKSEMEDHFHEYDCDWAKYLNIELGCSRISSTSSSDDDDDDDDGGGGGGSDGDGGCDVDVNGEDGEENEEEDDEGQADKHMKMFLENITADGTSYVLKREGRPDIKFEGMDDDGVEENEANLGFEEELSSDSESEKRRRRENDLDVRSGRRRGKGLLRAGGLGNPRNIKGNGKGERGLKGVNNVGKKQTFMEENNMYRSVEQVDLTQVERKAKNVKNVENQKKKRCLSENISNEDFDLEYKMFFDMCELEEDRLILVANGKRFVYGEDDNESLFDSDEVYVLDHAPDCMESNYAPTLNFNAQMEDDDLQCLGSCNAAENPLFRKAVMDILRKPYNDKEYLRLREDVMRRKLVQRHVDMRSGNTSFQQSTMGKSYLDHYADLKKQLVTFKNDNPKKLNILRGFFFYLERVADDGKFKPWLDNSCLAIIPPTG